MLKPKSDVELVPNKLYTHHRIKSRPKMDVGQVPNKLTKQPDNYNHEIQLTNKQYSDYII